MDINDIMIRLRNGDTMDEIAKDLTDALNEAGREFQKEQQQKAEEGRKFKKLLDACAALDEVAKEFYNHCGIPNDKLILMPEELDEIFKTCNELIPALAKLRELFNPVEEKPKPKVEKINCNTDEFSAAIDEFLDKFVR